jgi:molecular chaperone HscB
MTTSDLNFAADHFALFDLARAQTIDLPKLEEAFRAVQARVHPDRHAHGTAAERRLAMQWATRANEAYQTLKSPLARARYLLGLLGHDAQVESNTSMPGEFLMAQMELRETVGSAREADDEGVLDDIRGQLLAEMKYEYSRLEALIDTERNYPGATALVRQLMFQEKLLFEIDEALDAVTA